MSSLKNRLVFCYLSFHTDCTSKFQKQMMNIEWLQHNHTWHFVLRLIVAAASWWCMSHFCLLLTRFSIKNQTLFWYLSFQHLYEHSVKTLYRRCWLVWRDKSTVLPKTQACSSHLSLLSLLLVVSWCFVSLRQWGTEKNEKYLYLIFI